MKTTAMEKRNGRLPFRERLAYGVGGIGTTFVNDIVFGFILLYYNTILQMDARIVGWTLFIPRLWDAFMDPLMGHISDNFRSRIGRRRPFILFGGPLLCLSFFLLWVVPDGLSRNGTTAYLLLLGMAYYGLTTVCQIPYDALGAELSPDYHERTRVRSMRSICERIGSAIIVPFWWVTHLAIFGSVQRGFTLVCFVLAVVAAGTFIWVALGTREDPTFQKSEKAALLPGAVAAMKNGPYALMVIMWLLISIGYCCAFPFLNYICIYYVFGGDDAAAGKVMAAGGYIMMAVSLPGIWLATWLSTKIGKRNALFISLIVLAAAPISSWWVCNPQYPWLQLVFSGLLALAVPGATIFPYSMIADTVDLDEYRTNKRREGLYLALISFISKLAFSGSTLWISYCLHWVGFDEKTRIQSDSTLLKFRLIMVFMPLVIIGLSACLLFFYKLNERQVRTLRRILELRRQRQTADLSAGT